MDRVGKYRSPYYYLAFTDGNAVMVRGPKGFPERRRFYRHELLKIDKGKLMRVINTKKEASNTLKDTKNADDFFAREKTRKVKNNNFGYVWAITFDKIPYVTQYVHPQRVIDKKLDDKSIMEKLCWEKV